MDKHPEQSRLSFLFDNDHPDQVWLNASEVIRRIHPDYDFSPLSAAFRDIVGLFYGEYPGYLKISTLYHDLRHTMDVFMCAVRLMHGAHLSGNALSDDEVTMVGIAALMHDIGYAQQNGDETGSGAKYTKTHVNRSIAFMHRYLAEKNWPSTWLVPLERTMECTDPALKPSEIHFPDERARLIGMLVGTADLVGQMADRAYLEKLLFLYFEFKEANMGNFESAHDLLNRTQDFYKSTRQKLDEEFGSTYKFLENHFRDWFGVECNYYMESMARNIAYLAQVMQEANGAEFLERLRRRGIVQQARQLQCQSDQGMSALLPVQSLSGS